MNYATQTLMFTTFSIMMITTLFMLAYFIKELRKVVKAGELRTECSPLTLTITFACFVIIEIVIVILWFIFM